MNKPISVLFLIFIFWGAVFPEVGRAQAKDPQQIVRETTDQVLAIIKNAKSYSAKDPKRFTAEVTAVMERVIDFDYFARGVMGSYASAKHYKSLTSEADKAAFRERVQRFSSTFKQGLIDTYATSLLSFNGEKVETLPLQKGNDLSTGSVTVSQHIFKGSGKPYVVQYSMHRKKDGEWKLKNLIIEGINLGLTYRSQFATAADKYKGDIDKVIANWTVEPIEIDASKAGAKATR